MNEVVERLKKLISGKLLEEQPFDWNNVNTPSNLVSLHGELSILIKKFNDMNTYEFTRLNPDTSSSNETNETNEMVTSSEEVEKDLNMIVDEIVELYLKILNEGKNSSIRK